MADREALTRESAQEWLTDKAVSAWYCSRHGLLSEREVRVPHPATGKRPECMVNYFGHVSCCHEIPRRVQLRVVVAERPRHG